MCGGFGSRLKSISRGVPKPLIKINNKNFLEILIKNFSRFKFKKILLLCHYKHNLFFRKFHKKTFNGDYELTSLIGNVTIKDGKYFSHTHITFSDANYRVFGGHLFDARITAAGEFIMIPGENGITRQMNSEIGLPLWCLENKFE